ncbi:hypothetical protein LCGC14_1278370, partial [marine sediment metagenome]
MLKLQIGKMRAARGGGTRWIYVTHGGEELKVKVQAEDNGVYLVFDAPPTFNIAR